MDRRSDHHGGNVRCLDSCSLAKVEPDTRSFVGAMQFGFPRTKLPKADEERGGSHEQTSSSSTREFNAQSYQPSRDLSS